MKERQERYQRSDVRGLWFVKTKKPFPVQQAMPIFHLVDQDDAWHVSLHHPDDWAFSPWSHTWSLSPLAEFVGKAFNRGLQWAPLTKIFDIACDLSIGMHSLGRCLHCKRDVGAAYKIEVALRGRPSFPTFFWHQSMMSRRSDWPAHVLSRLMLQAADLPGVALIDRKSNTCAACGTSANRLGHGTQTRTITLPAWLREFPAPRYGTIEWNWFNRWVLLRD